MHPLERYLAELRVPATDVATKIARYARCWRERKVTAADKNLCSVCQLIFQKKSRRGVTGSGSASRGSSGGSGSNGSEEEEEEEAILSRIGRMNEITQSIQHTRSGFWLAWLVASDFLDDAGDDDPLRLDPVSIAAHCLFGICGSTTTAVSMRSFHEALACAGRIARRLTATPRPPLPPSKKNVEAKKRLAEEASRLDSFVRAVCSTCVVKQHMSSVCEDCVYASNGNVSAALVERAMPLDSRLLVSRHWFDKTYGPQKFDYLTFVSPEVYVFGQSGVVDLTRNRSALSEALMECDLRMRRGRKRKRNDLEEEEEEEEEQGRFVGLREADGIDHEKSLDAMRASEDERIAKSQLALYDDIASRLRFLDELGDAAAEAVDTDDDDDDYDEERGEEKEEDDDDDKDEEKEPPPLSLLDAAFMAFPKEACRCCDSSALYSVRAALLDLRKMARNIGRVATVRKPLALTAAAMGATTTTTTTTSHPAIPHKRVASVKPVYSTMAMMMEGLDHFGPEVMAAMRDEYDVSSPTSPSYGLRDYAVGKAAVSAVWADWRLKYPYVDSFDLDETYAHICAEEFFCACNIRRTATECDRSAKRTACLIPLGQTLLHNAVDDGDGSKGIGRAIGGGGGGGWTIPGLRRTANALAVRAKNHGLVIA